MNETITAKVIALLKQEGIKLDSPYDLEDVAEYLSNHSNTRQFFYQNEEPIHATL